MVVNTWQIQQEITLNGWNIMQLQFIKQILNMLMINIWKHKYFKLISKFVSNNILKLIK